MSTVGYGPPWRVDGPPPSAPKRGLLQAAAAPAAGVRIVSDVDSSGRERWLNGVEVYPYPPGTARTWDTCAPGSELVDKDDGDDDIPTPRFGAFTVYEPITCTAYRVWDQDEFKARAVQVFTVIEGAAVEREFLTGELLGLNPHLSDGNGTFPNLDAVTNAQNGLALLDGEIAKSARLGIIHMSPILAGILCNYYIFEDKTGVLRTINGNVVIPGNGYVAGATPAGHPHPAGTEEWMYATGPIDIRQSEVFVMPDDVSQALDRGIGGKPNSITYRAERYYLIDWDTTVQAAVLVDRCQAEC